MSPIPVLPHGGSGADFLARHYPDAPRPWLDLSTGINPWAYPHGGIAQASWQELPSPALDRACRLAAADYFGVKPEHLAILPGSQAAISLLPHLYPATSVAIVEPTYGEHRASWLAAGHAVERVGPEAIDRTGSNILVITNPNNPDGRTISPEEIRHLLENLPRGHWLVVDEAFADVDPELSVTGLCASNSLAVFRSFGKFFGLAGVRLGFLVAPVPLAGRLEAMIGPWPVAGPALAIGARAYADRSWHEMTRHELKRAMRDLHSLLRQYDLNIVGGTDLFVLTEHAAAPVLFNTLCRHGIYVRPFADNACWLRFGLPAEANSAGRLENALSDWSRA